MSERKSNRRGTRKKVGVTDYQGEVPTYAPSEDDWHRMEEAYGLAFSSKIKAEIVNIVQAYLAWEVSERLAPYASDVIATIKNIKSAIRNIRGTSPKTESREYNERAHSMANTYVFFELNNKLGRGTADLLVDLLIGYGRACDDAVASIQRQQGYEDGEQWDLLVCRLTHCFDRHGLPIGASKDRSKTASDLPSPFVRFIEALQTTLGEAVRYTHSSSSLAQAIAAARKKFPRVVRDDKT